MCGLHAGLRRTVAFYPENLPPSEVNVTVVITNVSVEFTKLGSFGNIGMFASNLVNSLDRSYLLKVSTGTQAVASPVALKLPRHHRSQAGS
jgi:hypothetical protein